MTTARRFPVRCLRATSALLCTLCTLWPLPSALAASAAAQASAAVIVPVAVRAWLGVPVSVQDLLLARDAPAGPATGDLVVRVASGTTPAILRALPLWIGSAVESRQAFGVDIVPAASAALLARGPAAAVSVAAALPAGEGGDGEGPLVITVAFN
ncbi:hypothetical protein [Roseateles sp. P5_D6]